MHNKNNLVVDLAVLYLVRTLFGGLALVPGIKRIFIRFVSDQEEVEELQEACRRSRRCL